ncbi:MAG: ABC transporter substrate-binding protein [Ignavibacteriales bacterium]|nr:ABC transporter substrate-binding protein [Ignavibacteriales bacterium]
MPQHIRASFLLIVVLSLIAVGCRKSAGTGSDIRLGLITYPADGLNGTSTTNAAALALSEVEAKGGLIMNGVVRKVRFVTITITEGSAEEAVAAVQQLINQENVVAIVGLQNSDEAIPAGGLAEQAGISLIAPIPNNRKVTEGRKFVFRIGCCADVEGKALAALARTLLGARTAAILSQANFAYSQTVAEIFRREFESYGGKITVEEKFIASSPLIPTQAARIKSAHPDVVLLPSTYKSVLSNGILLRSIGVRAPFLGPDSWSRTLLRNVPEFDGSYMVTNWCRDMSTSGNQKFIEAYRTKFATEPTETAALTYDACNILFEAIRRQTTSDARSIRDTLALMSAYEGVSGLLRFHDGGDPAKSLVVLQFKSGTELLYRIVPPEMYR